MNRRPLRTRLTFAYVALTAVTGSIMLGMIVLLSDRVLPVKAGVDSSRYPSGGPIATPTPEPPPLGDVGMITYPSMITSGLVALAAVIAVAAVLGWSTARRALRPVRTITSTVRRVADKDLHMRISLDGPADEIKELADAFDHMLMRLERSFASQRRFLANAAHELKSPVATQRAVIEVAMARPDAPPEVAVLGHKLLAGLDHQQRVLSGLLTLAQNADTIHRTECVDLARLVAERIGERADRATERVEPALDLATAKVLGEPVLLAQLVRNLVDNAFVHNEPGGWISALTESDGTSCTLEITNGGPRIDDTLVEQLFEPFHRLCYDRAEPPPGSGLGLSVVRAIAEAHGGSVTARPRSQGGLVVVVVLPPTGELSGAGVENVSMMGHAR